MPPRSKNGSTISSQVSRRTREGGGSVAPARAHSSSHTSMMSATITMGGTMRAASVPRRARIRLGVDTGLTASATTFAGGCASALASTTFNAGMFIATISVRTQGRAARLGRPSGLRFEALDAEALEIGLGVLRIEDLAVEEGLLAARGRSGNGGLRHRQRLGRLAPHILAVDLLDQRLGIDRR